MENNNILKTYFDVWRNRTNLIKILKNKKLIQTYYVNNN